MSDPTIYVVGDVEADGHAHILVEQPGKRMETAIVEDTDLGAHSHTVFNVGPGPGGLFVSTALRGREMHTHNKVDIHDGSK